MPALYTITPSLDRTMQKVVSAGGAIFYDRIRPQAGGTGTARTSISTTYAIPDLAKEILAIAPGINDTAPAAAESTAAVFDIAGSNFKYGPIELFFPIAGQGLTSIAAPKLTPQEWWETRIPVTPQSVYDWGIEPIDAQAGNIRAFVDIMYATTRTGMPVIHSLSQREQALGTAAGDQTAASLSLTDAKELVEVAGVATGSTVTAVEEITMDFTIRSDALRPLQQFRFGGPSNTAIIATSGYTHIDSISRNLTPGFYFSITNPVVNITANLDVALTAAGQDAVLVRYLGAGADPGLAA